MHLQRWVSFRFGGKSDVGRKRHLVHKSESDSMSLTHGRLGGRQSGTVPLAHEKLWLTS